MHDLAGPTRTARRAARASFVVLAALALPSGARLCAQVPGVGLPEGFTATVFVEAPAIYSPTAVAASPGGVVYVGECPYNSGGLREEPRGTVRACFDDDGDGRADRVTLFARDLYSPQGMCFAHGVLYVTHAPYLSAFRDADGDGVADERIDLVRGYGPRPEGLVHHIPSGVRLGVDGWLYSSFGDKGIRHAIGQDGREIRDIDTGGVIRVKPDGSGLELVTSGQRNIYDIAISPRLDAFTRDNTNDGDGWDTRLSHIQRGADYGYPRLFKNDAAEVHPPVEVLGAGGATGSLWVAEPWFPPGFGDALYMACWTRSEVFRHDLTIAASSFVQVEHSFLKGTRPIDLDVDGRGALYVSDWVRGGWDETPAPAGRILRITHALAKEAPPILALEKLSELAVGAELESPSAVRRLAAQRELVSRGKKSAPVLRKLARDGARLETRIAALFAVLELEGSAAGSFLRELVPIPELRAYALRALADRPELGLLPAPRELARFLADPDPRVRVEAAIALRFGPAADTPPALVAAAADGDPRLAHAAQQALRARGASETCLDAVRTDSLAHALAALRALSEMRSAAVVQGLTALLPRAAEPERRIGIARALAQLYRRDAAWDGSWFGTRPDSRGPLLRPEPWEQSSAIAAALAKLLEDREPAVVLALLAAAARVELVLPSRALAPLARRGGEVGSAAFAALRRAPDDDGAELLLEQVLRSSESKAERVTSIAALAKLHGEKGTRAVLALARGLGEATGKLAEALENALAGVDSSAHVSELLTLARGSSESVRRGALRALLASRSDETREARGRIWNDAPLLPFVVEAAAAVPARAEAARVLDLLDHSRFEVRFAAVRAVAVLGDQSAARPLLRALAERELRTPALRSLCALGPFGEPALDLEIARELALEVEATHGAADPAHFDFFLAATRRFLERLPQGEERQALESRLLALSGVLLEYDVAGPIPDALRGADALPPELSAGEAPREFALGEQSFAWEKMRSRESSGALRLHERWKACENATAYLHTTFASRSAGAAELRVGSDDQVAVWLNGALVHRNEENRGLTPEQDRFRVELVEGENRLLFRVRNGGGDFALSARLVGATTRLDSFTAEEIAAALPARGVASAEAIALGQRLFERSCAVCHTVSAGEPARGPYLGEAAKRFPREHLLESILQPNAKIAQGFATQVIEYVDEREELEEQIGFPSGESATHVELRDASGAVHRLPRGAIRDRRELPISVMPQGLVGGLTREQFAALIAYLEALR
ncbi:MAG: c-type cytochrome [Planctomycetes bacterium]|nr:c-type cytochrome [Planctomycetota bacterium]